MDQHTVSTILLTLAGVAIPSAASWITARLNLLPAWAQRLLQLLAMNVLHAGLGEPAKGP